MGRPRQFDPEQALEAAMNVFWHKGYQHTSISDLLEAMQINRWSMYETLGDKQQVFVKALNLYRQRWGALIAAHLQQPGSPRAALMSLLRAMGDRIVEDELGRGCLIANSAFQLATLEPEAAQIVVASLRGLETTLAAAITRAQQAGEVGKAQDPRQLARFLIAAINGIRGAAKLDASRASVTELVELALSLLH